ncbi:cell division protein FtsK, partial [Streptomyces tendae]
MKHPDDDNELFNRLEAEMAADSGGHVVDLAKARSARAESADRSADTTPDGSGAESADPSAPVMVDRSTPTATGPGYLGRLAAAKRRSIVPVWLRSTAELKTATAW